MDKLTYTETLVKAASLWGTLADQSTRKWYKHCPYWVRLSDGTLWMEIIHERTDGRRLQQLIGEGRVYVRENTNIKSEISNQQS